MMFTMMLSDHHDDPDDSDAGQVMGFVSVDDDDDDVAEDDVDDVDNYDDEELCFIDTAIFVMTEVILVLVILRLIIMIVPRKYFVLHVDECFIPIGVTYFVVVSFC